MRANSLLVASVCLNMVLAVGFAIVSRKTASPPVEGPVSSVTTTSTIIKPAILVRKQFFNWTELESEDYATYIANLRSVSCPEQTIRDIIVADVDQVFDAKKAALKQRVSLADIEWWKSPNDASSDLDYGEETRQLNVERSALLTQLLGPGWERVEERAYSSPLCFGGPVLSVVAPATRQRISDIVEQLGKSIHQLRMAAARTVPGDEGTTAWERFYSETPRLRNAAEAEIKSLLTPEQYEHYQLRNSGVAYSLRHSIPSGFQMTPDEFRSLFRSRATTSAKREELDRADESDPTVAARIKELDAADEAQLVAVLGATRAAEFTKMGDEHYRSAMSLAEEYTNASPATLQALFDINKAAAAEAASFENMTNWTDLQREIAAKRIELAQLEAQARALGQPVPEGSSASAQPLPEIQPPQPEPEQPTQRIHTIRMGDTLGSIATAYGLPVNAILSANPGLQLNQIRPGQAIVIPTIPAPIGSGR